ncbi:MAG: hypothetical protein SGI74_06145 [Oligoflexia bacterium]|nr:hypothetical protein [Oligoflexia bacterium]
MKKKTTAQSRRVHTDRKTVTETFAVNVKDISTGEVYFNRASIVDVSHTGLLLHVKRGDVAAVSLRSTLTFSCIHQASIGFTIEIMDTYIEGVVTRTKPIGKGDFICAVDFRDDAPEYWRQCLVDLLPDQDSDDVSYPASDDSSEESNED